MRMINCFAFQVRGERPDCKVVKREVFREYMKDGYCGTDMCPFFKTKKQHGKDREAVRKRLIAMKVDNEREKEEDQQQSEGGEVRA